MLNPVPTNSGAMHGYAHQAFVEAMMPRKVAAMELSGFAFFGNSISITTKIEKARGILTVQRMFRFVKPCPAV